MPIKPGNFISNRLSHSGLRVIVGCLFTGPMLMAQDTEDLAVWDGVSENMGK